MSNAPHLTRNAVVNAITHLWDECGRKLDTTVIPQSWYRHVCFKNGRADIVAIQVLADIVYWHRACPLKEPEEWAGGDFYYHRPKFRGQEYHCIISQTAEKYNIARGTVSEALTRLESYGLITKRYETRVFTQATCVVYVTPVPEPLKKMTYHSSLTPDLDKPASGSLNEQPPSANEQAIQQTNEQFIERTSDSAAGRGDSATGGSDSVPGKNRDYSESSPETSFETSPETKTKNSISCDAERPATSGASAPSVRPVQHASLEEYITGNGKNVPEESKVKGHLQKTNARPELHIQLTQALQSIMSRLTGIPFGHRIERSFADHFSLAVEQFGPEMAIALSLLAYVQRWKDLPTSPKNQLSPLAGIELASQFSEKERTVDNIVEQIKARLKVAQAERELSKEKLQKKYHPGLAESKVVHLTGDQGDVTASPKKVPPRVAQVPVPQSETVPELAVGVTGPEELTRIWKEMMLSFTGEPNHYAFTPPINKQNDLFNIIAAKIQASPNQMIALAILSYIQNRRILPARPDDLSPVAVQKFVSDMDGELKFNLRSPQWAVTEIMVKIRDRINVPRDTANAHRRANGQGQALVSRREVPPPRTKGQHGQDDQPEQSRGTGSVHAASEAPGSTTPSQEDEDTLADLPPALQARLTSAWRTLMSQVTGTANHNEVSDRYAAEVSQLAGEFGPSPVIACAILGHVNAFGVGTGKHQGLPTSPAQLSCGMKKAAVQELCNYSEPELVRLILEAMERTEASDKATAEQERQCNALFQSRKR